MKDAVEGGGGKGHDKRWKRRGTTQVVDNLLAGGHSQEISERNAAQFAGQFLYKEDRDIEGL